MSNVTTVYPESTLPVATAISTTLDNDGAHMSNVVTKNNGLVDSGNTTQVPLAAGAVFTGLSVDTLEYATLIISITADAPSATDGVEFQFSLDGITWKTTDVYTYSNGGTCKTWALQTVGQYFRVKYTNGGSNQTQFYLCTQLKKQAGVTSSHRVADNIEGQDDAALTKTILMAERAGGTPDVYTNVNATAGGNLKVSLEEIETGVTVPTIITGGLNLDSFERLRVAGTGNRSDADFVLDKRPLEFDDISGGNGTATFQTDERDVLLATGGGATSDFAGMRQHFPAIYTAGNGQLIFGTGTPDYADLGGTMYVFLRSSISGSPEYIVQEPQASWNVNTATGRNWGFSHIFGIDFQSLRVGFLRWYMDIEGKATKVHEQYNDNTRKAGYWQTPHLPPYARLYNTATNTIFEIGYGDEDNAIGFQYIYDSVEPTAQAVYICTTVKSEGGRDLFDLVGLPFVAYNAASPLATVTVSTSFVPVISFRVAALYNALTNRTLYKPTSYTIKTDNPIFYRWVYRPTLTGASWQNIDTIKGNVYTGLEYDVTASAMTGGYEIDADFLTTTRNSVIGEEGLLGRTIMSLGYGAASDIITLEAIRDTTTNAAVSAVLRGEMLR